MGPNFTNVRHISATQLEVTGVFDTHGAVIDEVVIRILVIPENTVAMVKPMVGEARLSGLTTTPPLPTAPPFPPGRTNDTLVTGAFSGVVTAPPNTYTVEIGDPVRIIGIAVAIKAPEAPADPQDPPGFETFTWCVTVEVVGP